MLGSILGGAHAQKQLFLAYSKVVDIVVAGFPMSDDSSLPADVRREDAWTHKSFQPCCQFIKTALGLKRGCGQHFPGNLSSSARYRGQTLALVGWQTCDVSLYVSHAPSAGAHCRPSSRWPSAHAWGLSPAGHRPPPDGQGIQIQTSTALANSALPHLITRLMQSSHQCKHEQQAGHHVLHV